MCLTQMPECQEALEFGLSLLITVAEKIDEGVEVEVDFVKEIESRLSRVSTCRDLTSLHLQLSNVVVTQCKNSSPEL